VKASDAGFSLFPIEIAQTPFSQKSVNERFFELFTARRNPTSLIEPKSPWAVLHFEQQKKFHCDVGVTLETRNDSI
jgi:hypothetical protein